MTFIGTSYIPDNACPCEEAVVQYREVHPGQWEAKIVSCPKNCEFPPTFEQGEKGNAQQTRIR